MPTSTLTSKGQVTVPKVIRERLDLNEGDTLEFNIGEEGQIVVRQRQRGSGICGVLNEFAPSRPVTVEEMNQAIRRRAAKKALSRSK